MIVVLARCSPQHEVWRFVATLDSQPLFGSIGVPTSIGLSPALEPAWTLGKLGAWESSCAELAATAVRGCFGEPVPPVTRLGAPGILRVLLVGALVLACVCSVSCCSFLLGTMSAVALEPGRPVLVSYQADPMYLHERYVLSTAARRRCAVLTPDHDVFTMMPPLAELLGPTYGRGGAHLRAGVTRDMCDLLADSAGMPTVEVLERAAPLPDRSRCDGRGNVATASEVEALAGLMDQAPTATTAGSSPTPTRGTAPTVFGDGGFLPMGSERAILLGRAELSRLEELWGRMRLLYRAEMLSAAKIGEPATILPSSDGLDWFRREIADSHAGAGGAAGALRLVEGGSPDLRLLPVSRDARGGGASWTSVSRWT